MKKSKGLTFFLSFVPGLGHFYLGQMNRGLQFMILFFGSIFLFEFLRLNAFPFVMPIIWFYSLFDVLEQHRVIHASQIITDPPVISWDKFKFQKKWLGWGMILLGIYLFIERLSFFFLDWQFYQTFRNIMVALIFILVGWFLLSGKTFFLKKEKKEVE